MKDKYYTPTLEELISHVIKGEIVYADVYGNSRLLELPTENSILYLMAFLKCHANIVGRSIVDLDPDQFRIKYLDGEDIKNCGFVYTGGRLIKNSMDIFNYKKDSFFEYILKYNYSINRLEVYKEDLNYFEASDNCLFNGTIRNISEFKTLLKQLNLLPSSI